MDNKNGMRYLSEMKENALKYNCPSKAPYSVIRSNNN